MICLEPLREHELLFYFYFYFYLKENEWLKIHQYVKLSRDEDRFTMISMPVSVRVWQKAKDDIV